MKNIQLQLTGLLFLAGAALFPTSMMAKATDGGTQPTVATPNSPGACGQAASAFCNCGGYSGVPSGQQGSGNASPSDLCTPQWKHMVKECKTSAYNCS